MAEKAATHETRFGKILYHHREAQGWSIRELEKASGVSASFISRLEREETSPTYEIIVKLARALNINPAEFFPEEDNIIPSIRKEFGPLLHNSTVRRMLQRMNLLDPSALKAVAVAVTLWVNLLRHSLHQTSKKGGMYKINQEFVDEMEKLDIWD
jgi:transcriptional regulator with XRE-family HTH domain